MIPVTPFTLIQKDGKWIAHSLALDIVAVEDTRRGAADTLHVLIKAQIAFALEHGYTMRNVYFAAPARYWNPPFFFMPIQ